LEPTASPPIRPRRSILISRLIFAALFVTAWFPVARYEASATGGRWGARVEGRVFFLNGAQTTSYIEENIVPRGVAQRMLLMQEVPFGFPYWLPLAAIIGGFVLAKRPKGLLLGAACGAAMIVALQQLEEGLRLTAEALAWPGDVQVRLTSTFYLLRAAAFIAVIWHLVRYRREARPSVTTQGPVPPSVSEARS
jgi:hypothetical protein